MKQPIITAAFVALFSFVLSSNATAQSSKEVVVVEIAEFNTEKNLEIYSLFSNDQEIKVINSCDALGWVVLQAQNEALSKAMVRAYIDMKILEVLESNTYAVVEDKQAMDVLEDCRAEMLRQSEVD